MTQYVSLDAHRSTAFAAIDFFFGLCVWRVRFPQNKKSIFDHSTGLLLGQRSFVDFARDGDPVVPVGPAHRDPSRRLALADAHAHARTRGV